MKVADVELQLKLFFYGLSDSLSFHRTLPTLVNNREAFLLVLQILGANGLLILGSVFLFQRGILPMVDVLGESTFDWYDQNHYNSLLWLLYQSLWLIPICGLCYGCSTVWYQSLADAITKTQKNGDKAAKKKESTSNALKPVEYTLYATISWLFVFIQVQLLTNYVPNSFAGAEFVVNKIFAVGDSPGVASDVLANLIRGGFLGIFAVLKYASLACGLTLMAALYGWYAFDPKWIADQVAPDQRFAIMESRLAYFIGFGFPYVLLNKGTSFFVGFGGFMMLFPFCIILGTVTDFDKPFRGLPEGSTNTKFRIFKPAEVWTLIALKYFGRKIAKKAERNYIKTASSSSKQSDGSNDVKPTTSASSTNNSSSRKNEKAKKDD